MTNDAKETDVRPVRANESNPSRCVVPIHQDVGISVPFRRAERRATCHSHDVLDQGVTVPSSEIASTRSTVADLWFAPALLGIAALGWWASAATARNMSGDMMM